MYEDQNGVPIFHVPHDGALFPAELTASVCVPGDRFLYYHEKMRDTGTLEMVPSAAETGGVSSPVS